MLLYADEMGETRAQAAIEALHLLGPGMAQRTFDLVERGNDAFAQGISRLGEEIATLGIPFHEVLTFMLFQWRGYTRILPEHARSLET